MTKKRGRPKGSKNKKKVIEQNKEEMVLMPQINCDFDLALAISSFFLVYLALNITGDIKEIKKELKNETSI